MTDMHSCSYYCDRPECVRTQRDELVRMYVEGQSKWPSDDDVELEGTPERVVDERSAFEDWVRSWIVQKSDQEEALKRDRFGQYLSEEINMKQIGWDGRAALQSVRPPAVPVEGHTISVKSCDGEWEGDARWEHQEQAYVTHRAVRPPAGVVSDEDVDAAFIAMDAAFRAKYPAPHNMDAAELRLAKLGIRAALESYASRHAPTKD